MSRASSTIYLATLQLFAVTHLTIRRFCIDINSPRTLQTATEKLFLAVSQYATDVPIIVVATKKDDFLDIEFGAHRKAIKKGGQSFDEEACEKYAADRLQERIEVIRSEMESVPGGRLDACLAVSQGMFPMILSNSATRARFLPRIPSNHSV